LDAGQFAGLEAAFEVFVDNFDEQGASFGLEASQVVFQGGAVAALPGVLEALQDALQAVAGLGGQIAEGTEPI
jgi:hypothetical protein